VIDYSFELRQQLVTNLHLHRRREHALDAHKHAVVAIVLVDSEVDHDDDPLFLEPGGLTTLGITMADIPGDAHGLDGRMTGVAGGAAFLLCRRAARMNRHAGQWALPGGRVDTDEQPLDAALREVDEELGLRLTSDALVGWLDDYPTRSGYVITPVVLWADGRPTLRPAPDEVRAVYRIGLHALRDGEPRFVTIPESERPVVQIPLGNDLIHAPTGAVLYQFRQVGLGGRIDERVDHLEQPVFAWR
jgi:8-oxo-dGTP pyrophosphatase MutT (NUDIX family)